jgi:biotin operon repressor
VSTIIMSACWPLQMPPTPKSVLISLADNANDNGVCWPSLTKIAERTCFGRTAVIEAIRWLEEHGLVVADRSNGRHTSYVVTPYDFHPDEPIRETDRSASRTSSPAAPVRLADRSASRINQSASRTGPVRQADSNRQEPSLTATVKKERASAQGSRLPSDWALPSDWYAWARNERPELDIRHEAEKFRDYWLALAGAKARKADWLATWRNWIRNANAPRNTGASHETHRKLSAGEQVRAAVAGREQSGAEVLYLDGEARRIR